MPNNNSHLSLIDKFVNLSVFYEDTSELIAHPPNHPFVSDIITHADKLLLLKFGTLFAVDCERDDVRFFEIMYELREEINQLPDPRKKQLLPLLDTVSDAKARILSSYLRNNNSPDTSTVSNNIDSLSQTTVDELLEVDQSLPQPNNNITSPNKIVAETQPEFNSHSDENSDNKHNIVDIAQIINKTNSFFKEKSYFNLFFITLNINNEQRFNELKKTYSPEEFFKKSAKTRPYTQIITLFNKNSQSQHEKKYFYSMIYLAKYFNKKSFLKDIKKQAKKNPIEPNNSFVNPISHQEKTKLKKVVAFLIAEFKAYTLHNNKSHRNRGDFGRAYSTFLWLCQDIIDKPLNNNKVNYYIAGFKDLFVKLAEVVTSEHQAISWETLVKRSKQYADCVITSTQKKADRPVPQLSSTSSTINNNNNFSIESEKVTLPSKNTHSSSYSFAQNSGGNFYSNPDQSKKRAFSTLQENSTRSEETGTRKQQKLDKTCHAPNTPSP